jgi:hypothetical protein
LTTRAIPSRHLWRLAAGFGVWCSALVVLYALHAIGCTFACPAGLLRLGLAAALVAHLIVIGWMWRDLAAAGPDPAFGLTGAFLHTAVVWPPSSPLSLPSARRFCSPCTAAWRHEHSSSIHVSSRFVLLQHVSR